MSEQPNKFISAYTSISPQPVIKGTSYVLRPFLIMTTQISHVFGNDIKDTYFGDLTSRYTANQV